MKNVDINKIVVSNEVSFGGNGLKYFIGYKGAENVYAYFSKNKCI